MSANYATVLGCPRSGTTYLMSVLNTLPEAACMNGTLLPIAVPHIVAAKDLDREIYDTLAVGFERAMKNYLDSGQYHSRASALQKWMHAPTGFRGLLRAMRGDRDLPKRFIYKEPFLSLVPEFVHDALPEAPLIHIYRDGRDVANSLAKSYDVLTDERLRNLRGSEMRLGRRGDDGRYVPWWVEEGRDEEFLESVPYVRAIWMWKHMVRRCHEVFAESSWGDQVLQLRYEDFMSEPKRYGRKILDHFGLASGAAFERRLEKAHARSVGKHRQRATAEVAAAEALAAEELELYGYL